MSNNDLVSSEEEDPYNTDGGSSYRATSDQNSESEQYCTDVDTHVRKKLNKDSAKNTIGSPILKRKNFVEVEDDAKDDEKHHTKKRKGANNYSQLNPCNLSKEMVQMMIINRDLVIGSPPKERGCVSDTWKRGFHFLFYKDGTEAINWFYCDLCGSVQNVSLESGTSNLRNHLNRHENESYSISNSEFAEILYKMNAIERGTLSLKDIRKCLPIKKRWSHDFIKQLQLLAVKPNKRPIANMGEGSREVHKNISNLRGDSNKTDAQIFARSHFDKEQDKMKERVEKAKIAAQRAEEKFKRTEMQLKALNVVLEEKSKEKPSGKNNVLRACIQFCNCDT